MPPTNLFEEIANLHAECSRMDKSTKLGWMMGERMRLGGLADRLARHVKAAGGFVNDAEREYARELLEMMQAVEAEGAKTANELRNEAITELAKLLMRG